MRCLDPTQAAAATCAAPVQLTLAGPGSGKTSTLTGRFVHLIRQGTDPTRILAVTFTKKAADEMRGRIARILELPSATGLNIMTFHAFAFRLLRRGLSRDWGDHATLANFDFGFANASNRWPNPDPIVPL